PEEMEGGLPPRPAVHEALLERGLREVPAVQGELRRTALVLLLRGEDRVLEGLAGLREVRPEALPGGEDELRLLDDLHRAVVLRPLEFFTPLPDGLPDQCDVLLLEGLPRPFQVLPGVTDGDPQGLALRNRLREVPHRALHVPGLGDDPVDVRVRLPDRADGGLEVPLPEGPAGLLEERERTA